MLPPVAGAHSVNAYILRTPVETIHRHRNGERFLNRLQIVHRVRADCRLVYSPHPIWKPEIMSPRKLTFDASDPHCKSMQIAASLTDCPMGRRQMYPYRRIGTSRDRIPSIDPERIDLPDTVCCSRDDFEIDVTCYQISACGDLRSIGGVWLNAWTSHATSAPLEAITSHGRQSLARRVSSWCLPGIGGMALICLAI